eukprot:scaffold244780_cov23-Prasinocladus_malaysianus.AAC.1
MWALLICAVTRNYVGKDHEELSAARVHACQRDDNLHAHLRGRPRQCVKESGGGGPPEAPGPHDRLRQAS